MNSRNLIDGMHLMRLARVLLFWIAWFDVASDVAASGGASDGARPI
jgi:hypothetical protein